MERRAWKNVLTFLLVLVLTVVTVATLSMATAAKAETAPAKYSQQVREIRDAAVPTAEKMASVPKESVSPLQSIGAFALILTIPGTGLLLFFKARKQGKRTARPGRRYSPRADMAFPRV